MEKIPPQSEQAEQAVLGGLLIESEAIWKIVDMLKPDDFYYPRHSKIYSAILELLHEKKPVDILTLSEKLQALGILDEVGGMDYLTYLINSVPSAFNIQSYAKIVVDKKIRRDLVTVSQEIFDQAFNENLSTEEILDLIEQRIFSVIEKSSHYEFTHIKNLLEQAYERIENLQKQETQKYRGIPTGFEELDNLLSGLQRSDFIILASRPSLGKTTLALDIARHVAVNYKIPVGIFSLEMSSDQIVDRLLAAEAGVSLWRLRTGKLYTEGEINEMALLAQAFDRLAESPIYIDDTPALNILQIRAMSRRLNAEVNGLGLIIIDYLQLIHSYKSYESRVQEITDISRSLKALARELQIPVLAISQLSRAPEQRASQVPRLSDLRESGSLEQDADVVMFIHRPDKSEFNNQVQIIVAKHRNGPRGIVNLYLDTECVSFRSLMTTSSPEIY